MVNAVILAAGLGMEVDEITESYQREPAPEDFDIAIGRVAKGTGVVRGRGSAPGGPHRPVGRHGRDHLQRR